MASYHAKPPSSGEGPGIEIGRWSLATAGRGTRQSREPVE